VDNCSQILLSYKKYCGTGGSSSGNLLLPESLKFLPAYVLSMLKHPTFRPGADVSPDLRMHLLSTLIRIPIPLLPILFYPRLYALHTLPNNISNSNYLPPQIRLSRSSIDNQGAYLLDNGRKLILWIGKLINPEILDQVFQLPHLNGIDGSQLHLAPLDTYYSITIRNIIQTIRNEHPSVWQALTIIKQGEPTEVQQFISYLVEDKSMINDAVAGASYFDFLHYVNREVKNKQQYEDATIMAMQSAHFF